MRAAMREARFLDAWKRGVALAGTRYFVGSAHRRYCHRSRSAPTEAHAIGDLAVLGFAFAE